MDHHHHNALTSYHHLGVVNSVLVSVFRVVQVTDKIIRSCTGVGNYIRGDLLGIISSQLALPFAVAMCLESKRSALSALPFNGNEANIAYGWRYHTRNAVFWDVMPCDSCKNRCFEGIYRFHHQGEKNNELGTLAVTRK
jgi:hypothetical protein